MADDVFKFDFSLQQVATDWIEANKLNVEADQNVVDDEVNGVSDVNQVGFFSIPPDGDNYFTITNPNQVRNEWIEQRKLVKSNIKYVTHSFVREKLLK